MAVVPASCKTAVNKPCRDGQCRKPVCPTCNRHICPVCRGHYVVMAFSEDVRGCNTLCVKISTDDTGPAQGVVKYHKVGEDRE